MPASEKLSQDECDLLYADDATKYHSIVGDLCYYTFTRLDISFVGNKVCRYLHEYRTSHWATINRILWHIWFTIFAGMLLCPCSYSFLSAFSDVDCVGSVDDRRSTGDVLSFVVAT